MQKLKVASNEAGQRLDKLLSKYLSQAGKGFLYKMMRKKNITLNGKKCDGSERVEEGDEISLFLADETIEKFSAPLPELAALGKEKDRNSGKAGKNGENGNRKKKQELSIVYEELNIWILGCSTEKEMLMGACAIISNHIGQQDDRSIRNAIILPS